MHAGIFLFSCIVSCFSSDLLNCVPVCQIVNQLILYDGEYFLTFLKLVFLYKFIFENLTDKFILGSSKQCFYCLKILWNPGNLQRHVEAQHVFSRKPNIFTCQHCTREFADIAEFVQHLHARKHYPNKLRRKKSTTEGAGAGAPQSGLAGNNGPLRLAPAQRIAARRTPSANGLSQDRRCQLLLHNDSGEDSDHNRLYNNSETDDDDAGLTTAVTATAAVASNHSGTFTCNQCHLSFDTLTQCARHIALGHSATTMTSPVAPERLGPRSSMTTLTLTSERLPPPLLSSGLFRGRRSGSRPIRQMRNAVSRRSLGTGTGTTPSKRAEDTKNVAVKAFAYECRRCSFATSDVDKLFDGAAVGHKCVAAQESGSVALLVMCAVCRVFLLDRTAVQIHRYRSRAIRLQLSIDTVIYYGFGIF